MTDAPLVPADIRRRLLTHVFGRRLYYLAQVDSTNRVAKGLAREGERHGTVVVTDYQSAGRGRRERKWTSPRMRNLLLSLLLRPERDAAEVLPLTLQFALALADVLAARCRCDVGVKWPNDVVADGGKLCGILSESSTRSGRAAFVIVGMGINVNMRPDEFPAGMTLPGASCFTIAGSEFDRTQLLVDVLAALENAYDRFFADGFGALVERYNHRCVTVGRDVRIDGGWGRAVGVQNDGGLVVARAGGEEAVLYDGEFESR